MAQLARLRKNLDAHERIFTTVQGFAQFVAKLTSTHQQTCGVRMCFLRGDHFTTERTHGTHLEFVDADSAQSFEEVRKLISSVPHKLTNGETFRLTVWEHIDLALFVPGTVYEIRHIFNFSMYENTPQACVARVCAEDRLECSSTNLSDAEQARNARSIDARQDIHTNRNDKTLTATNNAPATDTAAHTNSSASSSNLKRNLPSTTPPPPPKRQHTNKQATSETQKASSTTE
ncbi:hypothetical protein PRNP1_004927 [Phytophthora ramorum]